jgi:hypothetical protein
MGIVLAALALAAAEPVALSTVEASLNDRLQHSNLNDPYDLLGRARGSYLAGYGALFTVELNLVSLPPLALSPFSQGISKPEIAAMHDRKVKKLGALRDLMHELMLNAGATLAAMPAGERVTMEAFLFNYRWENATGLPHKVVMTADRQKLAEARAGKVSAAELAAIISETEY